VKILFDQNTPAPLRHALPGHEIATAYERGWHTLQNGELLAAAETDGFEALLTADQNLRYQQNLVGRRIAIAVLMSTDWRSIKPHTPYIATVIEALASGEYVEISLPPPPA
jgi:hypothetical protein